MPSSLRHRGPIRIRESHLHPASCLGIHIDGRQAKTLRGGFRVQGLGFIDGQQAKTSRDGNDCTMHERDWTTYGDESQPN